MTLIRAEGMNDIKAMRGWLGAGNDWACVVRLPHVCALLHEHMHFQRGNNIYFKKHARGRREGVDVPTLRYSARAFLLATFEPYI